MSTAYDVIVVGLGPTSLTLATLFGRRGMSVLVLDREPELRQRPVRSTRTTRPCECFRPRVSPTSSMPT
jgi:flavin-dependent dehydrogenase